MPFTLAHAAAALPLRRLKLVWSALVIGTFAPDLQYFLGLEDVHRESHTLPNLVTVATPLALLVLWAFHRWLKRPIIELAPEALRLRLLPYAGPFEFGGMRRFGAIVASIWIGIATHLLWDSFTHPYTWAYWHWAWLRESDMFPVFGEWRLMPHFRMLQYVTSIGGCLVLAAYIVIWYRSASPAKPVHSSIFTPLVRVAILALMLVLPWIAALLLAQQRGHDAEEFLHAKTFADYLILLPGVILSLELLTYGLLTTRLLKIRPLERR
jgi:hypothetical protein